MEWTGVSEMTAMGERVAGISMVGEERLRKGEGGVGSKGETGSEA